MNYQFTSRQLTLDNLSRSNQGHMTFKSLHLLNGASCDQILHGTHNYSKSYMVFQFTPLHLTLGGIERLNQDHWVLTWLCIIDQTIKNMGSSNRRLFK